MQEGQWAVVGVMQTAEHTGWGVEGGTHWEEGEQT